MLFIKNNYLIFTVFLIGFTFNVILLADVSTVGPMNRQLSKYISEGLSRSLTIQQVQVDLLTAETSVKESRAKFFPTLNLSSRYTRANGGRLMTFPVGDLLALMTQEPVHPERIHALNETTISIVPSRDQETKLQLSQPLFAPEIVQNYRMNTLLYKSKVAEVEHTQLTLVRNIRNAYYTCLQAKEAILVHSASCKRTASQLHTAKKLMNAGMLTKTAVLVAEAAHAGSITDSIKSCYDLENACQAFNVILNRSIDSSVTMVTPDSLEFIGVIPVDSMKTVDYSNIISKRRELIQLSYTADALRAFMRLEKSSYTPKLAAALEGGIVGENYEVTDKTRFFNASLILQWELFSGFSRKHRVHKALLALKNIEAKINETHSNILLQIKSVRRAQKIAVRRCQDSEKQLQAARKNYHEVLKRFEQGRVSTQELVDAQSFLTSADANILVSRYEVFRQWSMLRNAVAADTVYVVHASAKGL